MQSVQMAANINLLLALTRENYVLLKLQRLYALTHYVL